MSAHSASLGDWVRTTRLALGINQRELAERAALSRSYISDIERGRGAHPSLDALHSLASALGAGRNDIMRAAGYLDGSRGGQTDGGELRLIRLYRDLSPPNRATVERFIQFVHTEEYRWSQASFISADDAKTDPAEPAPPPNQDGPTLFELDPERPNGSNTGD